MEKRQGRHTHGQTHNPPPESTAAQVEQVFCNAPFVAAPSSITLHEKRGCLHLLCTAAIVQF